jgi:hypothetical protein
MDIPVFAKTWTRERWAEGVNIPVQHVAGGIITPRPARQAAQEQG